MADDGGGNRSKAGGPGGRGRTALAVVLVLGGLGAVAISVMAGSEERTVEVVSAPSTAPPTSLPAAIPSTTVPSTVTTARPVATTSLRDAPPAKVEFTDAVARGILTPTVRGSSLTSVRMSVTSSAAENLLVTVLPATTFESQAAGVQDMVAVTSKEFRIAPGGKVDVTLNAACASMALDTPTSSTSFTVGGQHSGELVALLGVPGFAREPFRIQQFAVWTITDNPSRWGYTGLTGSEGSGPPTAEEIDRIRELFDAAGIPPSSYRALR